MRVVFFHRKPRPNANFSVENLFKQIRANFTPEVNWTVKELSYFSDGLWKRIYITIEAAFHQEGINHITGDVNYIAAFMRKRKTVLTMLDVGFMKHPNRWARIALRWFWIVMPVKRSAIITTISESTKQELLKYVKVDPERVKVIYVPISEVFVSMPKAFNKSMPVILQIGTKTNKNVLRLIQALKGISCKLELVGALTEEMIQALQDCNVQYTAFKNLTNEEILARYAAADVISFVSTYEGFGMPIVEANAIGRVVVTSNILSMPEVGGNAAHFVDPFNIQSIHDGIKKVIDDDQYRERLIVNGFENRKRFDVTQIANQYTAIYKSLEV